MVPFGLLPSFLAKIIRKFHFVIISFLFLAILLFCQIYCEKKDDDLLSNYISKQNISHWKSDLQVVFDIYIATNVCVERFPGRRETKIIFFNFSKNLEKPPMGIQYKNIINAFHNPKNVIEEPTLLAQMYNGLFSNACHLLWDIMSKHHSTSILSDKDLYPTKFYFTPPVPKIHTEQIHNYTSGRVYYQKTKHPGNEYIWPREFVLQTGLSETIFDLNITGMVCFKKIYYANANSILERPKAGTKVYSAIREKLETSELKMQVLVYDKHDSWRRRWLNSEEFVNRVRSEFPNWEVLWIKKMNELTAKQQWRLFQQSRFFIGSHGGHMGNTVFMQPGTFAVEMCCFKANWNAKSGMNKELGFNMKRVVIQNCSEIPRYEREKDFYADTDELMKIMKTVDEETRYQLKLKNDNY